MASKLHSWFVHANVDSKAKMRLICFPYAGGGASIYRDWQKLFPNEIEVCAVQLPGRESRSLEEPVHSLDQLVHSIVDEIQPLLHLPYIFFGHSMGALLAFETARQLSAKYNRPPEHLFVSGRSAPQYTHRDKKLHLLPDNELKEELRLLNGTPDEILQNSELMDLVLPRLRADFQVCETYTYTPTAPLNCSITVYGGTEDSGVSMESLAGWKQQTRGSADIHMLRGDHFFLHNEQKSLALSIQNELDQHVHAIQGRLIGATVR